MLGTLERFDRIPPIPPSPPNYTKLELSLCPERAEDDVTMVFLRWDKYEANSNVSRTALSDIANSSDYLVMNWGAHFQPWPDMVNATQDFVRLLETNWAHKKAERLFWRSTIAAHANCGQATGPDDPPNTPHESQISYAGSYPTRSRNRQTNVPQQNPTPQCVVSSRRV